MNILKKSTILLVLSMLTNLMANDSEYNIAPNSEKVDFERPIVVCVPSYNNKEYYKTNLDSIFNQKYTNFRVIYVDDASIDNTSALVSEYIIKNDLQNKVKFISNEVNKGALRNLYDMIHSCNNEEIIVCVDGDDWLKHDKVFLRLNSAYQDEKVWVTYGQYIQSTQLTKGPCHALLMEDLKKKNHRAIPWIFSHLRTFYAGLFKKIPESYFRDSNGEFFSMTWDMAIMFNLLDMGPTHVFFIPDVLYVYNTGNRLSDFRVNVNKQCATEQYIKQMAPMEEVSTWR